MKFNKDIFFPILILIIGLISFTWVPKSLVVSGGDFAFNFIPKVTFNNYYSVWSDFISLGGLNSQALPVLPLNGVYYLFSLINFPLWLVQKFIFYFLFVSGGLGTYFLIKSHFEIDPICCFWAGLFYMLNPFSLIFVWGIPGLLLFAYAGFPVILNLFSKGINERKLKNYLLILIIFLVYSPLYGNLSYLIILWLLLFIYFIFNTLIEKNHAKQKIIFFIMLFSSWLILNSFWLFPYLLNIQKLAQDAVYIDSGEILIGSTRKAGFYNSLRLFGYPVFFDKFMGSDAFYLYADSYKNPFMIIVSAVLPIMIFYSLLIKSNKTNKYKWFFLGMFITTIFIFKGYSPPFGNIYLYIIKNIPFAASFRNPLDKFGTLLVLSMVILSAISLNEIRKIFTKIQFFYLFFIAFVVILQGIFVFPFWQMKVYGGKGKIRPSLLSKMPEYYYELSDWLSKQSDEFRILAIPINNIFGVPYKWDFGHGGSDPVPFALPKPMVFFDSKMVEVSWHGLIDYPYGFDATNDKGYLASRLAYLNVKYLMVHNDIEEKYFNIDPVEIKLIKQRLRENYFDGITFEKKFGGIDIYKLSEKYYKPVFYFPAEITLLRSNSDNFWTKTLMKDLPKDGFYIYSQNSSSNNEKILNFLSNNGIDKKTINLTDENKEFMEVLSTSSLLDTPTVKINKKLPGYYQISFKNIVKPNFIVFSENFDQNWKAFQNNKELEHFKVNYYANAWIVEEDGDIEIIFKQQGYYWKFLCVSGIGYLILILLGISEAIKKRN